MDGPSAAAFDPGRGWRLHPQVALRPEEFGALAYHYGNRRLVFLKSPRLVSLVSALADHPTADGALEATVPATERDRYRRALAHLAASEVIDAR
ncbi:MAG: mycofactocin biosynthesis chaperone MftB [Acidimicrobiales bacterium]